MKPPSKKEIDKMSPEQLKELAKILDEQSKLSLTAEETIKKKKMDHQDKEQIQNIIETL